MITNDHWIITIIACAAAVLMSGWVLVDAFTVLVYPGKFEELVWMPPPFVVELEERVKTLEKSMEVCCGTEEKPFGVDRDLEYMVRLRQEVQELRERIEELEK